MQRLKLTPAPVAWRALTRFALLAVLASCSGHQPSTSLLFAADETRLDRDQQQTIVNAIAENLPLADDGGSFVDANCGNLEPEATPVDLNGDGVFEVFVQWGNTCTSGAAGRSLNLYVRDADGGYRPQFGFPALGWSVRRSRYKEWPDLSFGGPGFCHPVWTWQHGEYTFMCNRPEAPGGCADRGNVCKE